MNSGSILICDILISELCNAREESLDFIRNLRALPKLSYSGQIADSEKANGYRNLALCNFIEYLGNIENEPHEGLNFD